MKLRGFWNKLHLFIFEHIVRNIRKITLTGSILRDASNCSAKSGLRFRAVRAKTDAGVSEPQDDVENIFVFSSSGVSVSNRKAEQDDRIVNNVRCANNGQGKAANDAIQDGKSLIARAGVM
jgi:hypothetical protein